MRKQSPTSSERRSKYSALSKPFIATVVVADISTLLGSRRIVKRAAFYRLPSTETRLPLMTGIRYNRYIVETSFSASFHVRRRAILECPLPCYANQVHARAE